ncbi:MAG: helix-turn-helix domain-containing protein [Anaeroplasmataceae bacterium]|nr:helix-turn-helix domain-containing protein [Anaeroplasmataceae bacterium]MDE5868508.1 helix-turn-helix domain-containing protein [Anaeroplasmataceae bacterium]
MQETFGTRFQRLRKKYNLTQEDVASKVGVSAQAVSKWENDLSAPDISILPTLADMFHVSLDELLGREVVKTEILPEAQRKNIDEMLFKINVDSSEGDRVRVKIPVSIIKICLESGVAMPSINGKDILSQIDFKKIFALIEQGVIGELISVDSADGDQVRVIVE